MKVKWRSAVYLVKLRKKAKNNFHPVMSIVQLLTFWVTHNTSDLLELEQIQETQIFSQWGLIGYIKIQKCYVEFKNIKKMPQKSY